MAPCAEQTSSWEVSWICATAHPACPPCDPYLHIKDPSTNNLPPKLLPTTLGCTHTCIEPSSVRPAVYFSTGSCIRPLSPFEFVAGRSLSLMLMSRRKVKAGFTISWTCRQSTLCRAHHSWFAFQAQRGAQRFPPCSTPLASTIPLVSHPAPP